MRSTFETEDLQAIAEMVARKLAPLLAKVQEAVERPVLPPPKPLPLLESEVASGNKAKYDVVRNKQLRQLTGLSNTTIWRLEREGAFPARIRLSQKSVGWRRSEIETWLATRQSA
jgi:predicted DNA-binding transcriptional regulator AlpA